MPDNIQNSLTPHVVRFFKSLTVNKNIIDLAIKIQQNLEQGHSCIENKQIIDDKLISQDGQSGYIVQNKDKAGFRRFYNQETYIRDEFSSSETKKIHSNTINQAIQQTQSLDNSKTQQQIDLQWQASLAFLYHSRFILSGGPGTGKTTTVIRMLMLYSYIYPNKKIALAAPTGKAANRMMQSINSMSKAMNLPDNIQEKLPTNAQTLHRLLGYNPQNNKLKYNQNNPISYDLIIVDEASMLDISMTYSLLKALKSTTQLILIGDKNQLPAVEAGNVFADLCKLAPKDKDTKPIINILKHLNENKQILEIENYVELQKNYRFIEGSIVANLSQAMIKADLKKITSLKNTASFNWHNPQNKAQKISQLKYWYKSIPANETSILLSPVNFGDNSVEELNQLATQYLYGNNHKNENMPIMVAKNDYTLNIFNGDISNMKYKDNKWQAAFIINGKKQYIQLDAIHSWQIAHAISIHKSQGSEYDHVLIAIPDDFEKEILTNQLLYTAITRAKSSITLWASDKIINKIISTNATRMTFLN